MRAITTEQRRGKWLTGINLRRWQLFRANRRGFWSFWIFLILFVASLFAEFLANDRPIIAYYKGEWLLPVFVDYPEEKFGGFYAVTDFRDAMIQQEIESNGWMVWPPIRYSYRTVNTDLPSPAPSPPAFSPTRAEPAPNIRTASATRTASLGNMNWLGTDDQGRDVIARLIYGFRISVLFGLTLTIASSIIGVIAGAVQGYFGGWIDLVFQRLIEVWTSVPTLYLLMILAAFIAPNFWILLAIMLLFSWTSLVGVVRAEFLRAPQFRICARGTRPRPVQRQDHVQAHPAQRHGGDPDLHAVHPLGLDHTLTSLDFLGFGLPPGSPSLGELMAQGKSNLQAPWLGITGFVVMSLMLSLLSSSARRCATPSIRERPSR